jgi:hypothetical protein
VIQDPVKSGVITAPRTPTVVAVDKMRQLAETLARSGVQALAELQKKPESRFNWPFIFRESPEYQDFIRILKGAVERQKLVSSQAFHAPSAFGLNSRF